MAFLDWDKLTNPFLGYPQWSIKDACCAWRDGVFHLFFSTFDDERCHLTHVTTLDFRTFSDFVFCFSGREEGYVGLCSPDIVFAEGRYVLAHNSWGDDPARPNQLFYMESPDLEHWGARKPLAPEVTQGARVIDAALAFAGERWMLFYKRWQKPMVASALHLDGPWALVGDGRAELLIASGRDNGLRHENFQLSLLDGRWRLLTTDFAPHHPYLYTMAGSGTRLEDWLHWEAGYRLEAPVEAFNPVQPDNAAALCDWRKHDGHFYLLYAGHGEERRGEFRGTASPAPWPRGWNRLALARSRDLVNWSPPGGTRKN